MLYRVAQKSLDNRIQGTSVPLCIHRNIYVDNNRPLFKTGSQHTHTHTHTNQTLLPTKPGPHFRDKPVPTIKTLISTKHDESINGPAYQYHHTRHAFLIYLYNVVSHNLNLSKSVKIQYTGHVDCKPNRFTVHISFMVHKFTEETEIFVSCCRRRVLMILIVIPVREFNYHILLFCFGKQKGSLISFVLHCGLLGFMRLQHTPTLLTLLI